MGKTAVSSKVGHYLASSSRFYGIRKQTLEPWRAKEEACGLQCVAHDDYDMREAVKVCNTVPQRRTSIKRPWGILMTYFH